MNDVAEGEIGAPAAGAEEVDGAVAVEGVAVAG
jgi:hypothetical protein